MKSLKSVEYFSHFNPSPLSIKQFIEFGQTATGAESFSFLSKEIPVRLSNIMKEINLLPGNLLQMPSVLVLQVIIVVYFVFCTCTLIIILSITQFNRKEGIVRLYISSTVFQLFEASLKKFAIIDVDLMF